MGDKNLTKEEREKIHEQKIFGLMNKEKSRKLRKKILFYLIILLLVGGFTYYGIYTNAQPGKYDNFAKCLTEKEVKEYGAFWCSSCADQKKLFGKSFKYITYIECDARGSNSQLELCQEKGITGYPTWEHNNTKYQGVRSLEGLSEISGCKLS